MNNAHVLVLHGSPGSGKSTLAGTISDLLRVARQTHAVIDVDELARVYPENHRIQWANLAAVWPNYMNLADDIKIILPVLIDTEADLAELKSATPCSCLTICELIAAPAQLTARVTAREPTVAWQNKLCEQVAAYHQHNTITGDIKIDTGKTTVEHAAAIIVNRMGWDHTVQR